LVFAPQSFLFLWRGKPQGRWRGGARALALFVGPIKPLGDWTWLYWYFVRFAGGASPFNHSRCFDVKTALSVKARRTVSTSGRDQVPAELLGKTKHTHHALDDAREQAEIFANLFDWNGG
jgi:hypothetical protein